MTAIVLFGAGSQLPAYLSNRAERTSTINTDVVGSGPAFPVLSIKGKVFTLVRGQEKKVLTRMDDPDEVLQNLSLAVVRANTKSRVFYAKAYVEGESDGSKPTCFSNDGVAPDPQSAEKQSKKCAICPQNVWGVKEGKGTACSSNTRLAVVDPDHPTDPMLLRVPPASRKGFAEAVKLAESKGLDYNMMVLKVGFDKEAPSPKLTFKPIGLLGDAAYETVKGMYEDEVIKEIVSISPVAADEPAPAPQVESDELDAAIAARAAVTKAAAAPAKAAPKAEAPAGDDLDALLSAAPAKAKAEEVEVPKTVTKPSKAAVKAVKAEPVVSDSSNLLGDLDALLSATDD